MSDNNNNSFITFALGALVGAAIAILYAPQAGKDTRRHLKRLSEDFADTAEELSSELRSTGRRLYEDGSKKVADGIEKITKTFDKIEEEVE